MPKEVRPFYFQNRLPFTKVVGGRFGRYVIYTNASEITRENILEELSKALTTHNFNARAIRYLDGYYRGDQPILYRKKEVREEINNKVVENHAIEIVDSKVADIFGEPVQYAAHGDADMSVVDMIRDLNNYMDSEDKAMIDISHGKWASICGTSYVFVGNRNRMSPAFDEAPFYLKSENPADTFVCYFADDYTPAFSCQIRTDADGVDFYIIYTSLQWFRIADGVILESGINGNGMIPVIEYPNNERRLSDIEITITMTDELNKMQSDRMNGIEQFVQALMLFKNCEISENKFLEMCKMGALSIKTTTAGYDADVRMLTAELNQTQTQTAKDDVYKNLLIVQGKPGREEASGGDTGQAVVLRNGYYDEDKRAELRIPLFKKCERMMLRCVLNKLRVASDGKFDLKITDIDIKPKRSKLENMMVKAQVLQILHQIGVDDADALKTVNLFSDVTSVYAASKDRMQRQFDYSVGQGTVEELPDVNANASTDRIIAS